MVSNKISMDRVQATNLAHVRAAVAALGGCAPQTQRQKDMHGAALARLLELRAALESGDFGAIGVLQVRRVKSR